MDIGQVKGGPKGYKGGKGPKGPKGSKGQKGNDSKGKYGKAGGKESKGYSQNYNNAKGDRNPGKGGKGDRKGKNNAPKGGNLSSNTTCHNCGRPGHYARDCWRPRVNQVEQSQGQPGPQPSGASVSGTTTSAGPSYSSAPSQASTAVRRVIADPFVMDMSQLDLSGDDPFVRMIHAQHFRLDATDGDSDWVVIGCSNRTHEQHVRALTRTSDTCSVIIDSGADVSCIPLSFASCGVSSPGDCVMHVRDAQGGSMQVKDERIVDFVLQSPSHGHVTIRERCIVADVLQPLISMGRLIKQGWFPCQNAQGFWLNHDASGADVPMTFRGMSLGVDAEIRRVEKAESPSSCVQACDPQSSHVQSKGPQVQACDPQSSHVQSKGPQVQSCDPQSSHVQSKGPQCQPDDTHVRVLQRAVLGPELSNLHFGWQILTSGNLCWRGRSSRMLDPSFMVDRSWPLRSTLMRRSETSAWFLIEHCESWLEMEDLEDDIPGGGEAELIVCMHVSKEPMSSLGVENLTESLVEDVVPSPKTPELPYDEDELFDYEPSPVDEPDASVIIREEPASRGALPDMEEPLSNPVAVPADTLTLDGVVLNCESSIGALKAACTKLGLRTSGSKTRLFQRIKGYLEKQKLSLASDIARDASEGAARLPHMQSIPDVPSREQQLIHELTHTPYAAWCSHCITMRSVPDRSEATNAAPRDLPSVSFDFCYTGFSPSSNELEPVAGEPSSSAKDLLCCLIAHDSATGAITAIPCESKGSTRYLGVELMRFIQSLGHATVELRCDAEPATLSLQRAVVNARQRLGLKTVERNPPVGHHQANGYVEKAVDLIRRLACTLLDMVRHKTGCKIDVVHPLFAWSFVHAAWVRNRFAVAGGLTAYERTCNAAYTGKLVAYGEPVFAQVHAKKKGDPKWLKAIFLTKTSLNDMYVVASKGGVRVTRSVRRTGHEWKHDAALYADIKGFPWNYSSGVIGTKMVPPAKTRKALPAPSSPQDVAASDPPETPVPMGLTPAMGSEVGPNLGTPAEALPPTPVGGSVDPEAPKVPFSRPPPPSSRVPESVPTPGPELPNPSQRPHVPPATPVEDLLPLTSPVVPSGTAMETDEASDVLEERASKVPRIRTVSFGNKDYDLNDEPFEFVDADWSDFEFVDPDYDKCSSTEPDSAMKDEAGQSVDASALWFPDNGCEPKLSESDLFELDRIADAVEVNRLIQKGVLRPSSEKDNVSSMKSLSTKMVRTWRQKKRNGMSQYLRRSRLVAREYKWLEEKQGLFSPSTTTNMVKLIPILFLLWRATRQEQYAICAIDVKDAYLEVPQEEPVVADLPKDCMLQGQYVFEKCVPGQRDGAQRWFGYFVQFLTDKFDALESCVENPAIMRVPEGPMIMHVDDGLTLAPLTWLKQKYIPTLPSRFEISVEIAYKNGDVFSFLKRKHTILESGILVEASSSYIRHMAEVLDVKHGSKHNTPYLPELIREDVSGPLDPVRAGKFRSALGIALYLSSDRIDICYSVRLLAGFMSNPTEQAWKGLIRLAKYLLNTAEYATLLSPKLPGSTVFREANHDDMPNRIEIYSDSDWSGHRVTRKSFGIFLRAIFAFMAAITECSLDLKIDNSAARQLALRQGVGNKTRHVAGRLLWLQQSVREKIIDVGAIASIFNLGDLSTKMHSANRLRALLFLHGFVDAFTGKAIGEEEFAQMALQDQAKMQVKRVRTEYARQHGVTGSLKGEASRLTKQVALLTLLCLPTTGDAAEAANPYQRHGMANVTWATVLLCCGLCIYRALSWARDFHGFDMNSLLEMSSQDFATKMIMSFIFLCGLMPECTMEQYMCFFLLGVVWTMHRYILQLEHKLQPTSTEPTDGELMQVRSDANVRIVVPQELFVTRSGECFHHRSCGTLKSSLNPPRRLSTCSHCKDMLTRTE